MARGIIPAIQLYWEVIRLKFLNMLAYRIVYFTGIFNYSLSIGVYYFLWDAIYQNHTQLGGLSLNQMITYVAVAWISRTFYFNNLDKEIAREVRKGQVAVELLRPYNYLLVKTAQGLGESIFRLFFFTLPSSLFVFLVFPVSLPPDWQTGLLFLVSMALSFWVFTQLNLLTGLTAFFTLNTVGFVRAKRVAIDLFSGLLIPLTFYPAWVQAFLPYLPFQAITYLPNMIYTGAMAGEAAYRALGTQFLWCVALFLLSQAFYRLALRRTVIQGG